MFYSLILCLLASVVFAGHAVSKNKKGSCSRQLESVVYTPETCGYKYLKRLSNVLRIQTPLLFGPQNGSVIDSFEATYGVTVGIADAMGTITRYVYDNAELAADNALPLKFDFSAGERAYALGEGYANGVYSGNLYYDSVFWGEDGQMMVVSLFMSKENEPIGC